MHVLIVEDDPQLGQGLQAALKRWTYTSQWVTDGATAITTALHTDFDIALLDLGLPTIDGIHVLKRLRRSRISFPILVITARESLGDRVIGLDAGADDYLVKPFELDELGARLRALYRRATGNAAGELRVANLFLDERNFHARYEAREVDLSRTEFLLMRTLAERAGRIVPREFLEQVLFGDEGVESNALEFHIHSLRKKLGTAAIRTARGLGYYIPGDRKL
jgi:two-component system response regulator QseB